MDKTKTIPMRLVRTESGDYRVGYQKLLPANYMVTIKDNRVLKVEPIDGVC